MCEALRCERRVWLDTARCVQRLPESAAECSSNTLAMSNAVFAPRTFADQFVMNKRIEASVPEAENQISSLQVASCEFRSLKVLCVSSRE